MRESRTRQIWHALIIHHASHSLANPPGDPAPANVLFTTRGSFARAKNLYEQNGSVKSSSSRASPIPENPANLACVCTRSTEESGDRGGYYAAQSSEEHGRAETVSEPRPS